MLATWAEDSCGAGEGACGTSGHLSPHPSPADEGYGSVLYECKLLVPMAPSTTPWSPSLPEGGIGNTVLERDVEGAYRLPPGGCDALRKYAGGIFLAKAGSKLCLRPGPKADGGAG